MINCMKLKLKYCLYDILQEAEVRICCLYDILQEAEVKRCCVFDILQEAAVRGAVGTISYRKLKLTVS